MSNLAVVVMRETRPKVAGASGVKTIWIVLAH
jgi:hypothetical protein